MTARTEQFSGSGIYEIVHTASGKRYIGSAGNINKRWGEHRRALKHGDHRSSKLQRAWNKYGAMAFEFRKILTCPLHELLFNEQRCLDEFLPEYNVCKVAGSPRGLKHPPGARTGKAIKTLEWRDNISKSLTGYKQSAERRAQQSARAKGIKRKPFSPEWLANIAKAAKNRSPEWRANLCKGQQRRAPFPPEHCVKLAAAANRRWDRVRAERASFQTKEF